MKKFGIKKTKDNEEIVVKTFEDKDEAMAFGAAYFKNMERQDGILTLVNAEFDENDQFVDNERRIFHVWY